MRDTVGQAADALQSVVGRVRTWFHPRLGRDARPIEIREAVLEDVEARVEPAGGGRRVLPYNRLLVTVLAPTREQRMVLEAALADLQRAVAARLSEIRCDTPFGLQVETEYAKRPRAGWAADQCLAIEYGRSAHPVSRMVGAAAPALTLTVVRGTAAQPTYTLAERRILIGRTAEPVDHRGRTRRNHVVFEDEADEYSATVGRAHACIQFDPGRSEYRLYDEGSRNGTRVLRDGAVLELPPSDPVGIALMAGDEIRFGTAAVVVRIDEPSEP